MKIFDLRLVTGEPSAGHLVTLVFDQLDASSARNARTVAGKVLKTSPERGFTFAVLNIQARLRLFQDFTADRGALEKAVSMATEGGNSNNSAEVASAEKDADCRSTHRER